MGQALALSSPSFHPRLRCLRSSTLQGSAEGKRREGGREGEGEIFELGIRLCKSHRIPTRGKKEGEGEKKETKGKSQEARTMGEQLIFFSHPSLFFVFIFFFFFVTAAAAHFDVWEKLL